jgi:putative sigma-54 modulation protein
VQFDIHSRNYEPSKRVRSTIEERSQKLLKFADIDRLRFTLTGEHVQSICEVHVHVLGKDFHSKAASEDMLSSVDKAVAVLEKQLRRYKTKREDARRGAPGDSNGLSSAAALEAEIKSGEAVTDEE